jgi:hypothetical protein
MKKQLLYLITITVILQSCSGTQKTKSAISSGNYQAAFDNAITKLNKDKKKYAKQIPLLKEAYDKANAQDLAIIKKLKKQNSSEALKTIYKKYMNLDVRQDEITLLEPLTYDGKTYHFDKKDYSNEIAKAKKDYSDNLYKKALPLLNSSKQNARKAYELLSKIQVINPDYRNDLSQQIDNAKKKGMQYVIVKFKNNIANKLNDSTSLAILKNFASLNTGNFTNKWITFHDKQDYSIIYDYQTDISLDKIIRIPEKINTQKVLQEKEIQTGWDYKLDPKGNVIKDKDGNDIKTPKMEKVKAEVTLFQQIKSTSLEGKLTLKNLKTNKIVGTTPVKSEAKLENIYATYKGNPKAIDQKYYDALNNKKKQFPNDIAFTKFALQTFKEKTEAILAQQKW